METFSVVISGVAVYFIGQLFLELCIKPMQRYKLIRSNISFLLYYYGNILDNVPFENERYDKNSDDCKKRKIAENEFRKSASELIGFIEERSCILFWLPTCDALHETSKCLIGLSNGLFSNIKVMLTILESNRECIESIRYYLKLYKQH